MDDDGLVVEQGEDFISVDVGLTQIVGADGRFLVQKDYRVAGEVWRVHKNDPDPFPSQPHAHCVGGADRFVGCKLHLGTAELFDHNNKPTGRFLYRRQFEDLCRLVKRKFPGIELPLPT